MSEKKLYRVELNIEFYAYTETEREAQLMVDDFLRDTSFLDEDTFAHPITRQDQMYWPPGWTENSLVYTSDGTDVKLGDIVNALPKKKEDK
jgi:hypothetical protein